MPIAIVYEWDHVSRGLLYAKSLTKSPWRYSKKIFKLYKSAEVHTKQPRKVPGLVWFLLAAVVGVGVLAPTTYARLTDRINGGKPTEQASTTPASAIGAKHAAAPATPASTPAAPAPVAAASAPVFAGCISTRERCECFDTQGQKVTVDVASCVVNMQPSSYVLSGGSFPEPPPPPHQPSPPQFVPHYNDGLTFADIRRAMRERP